MITISEEELQRVVAEAHENGQNFIKRSDSWPTISACDAARDRYAAEVVRKLTEPKVCPACADNRHSACSGPPCPCYPNIEYLHPIALAGSTNAESR